MNTFLSLKHDWLFGWDENFLYKWNEKKEVGKYTKLNVFKQDHCIIRTKKAKGNDNLVNGCHAYIDKETKNRSTESQS